MKDFSVLTIFAKSSILDVCQGSEFASEASNNIKDIALSQMFDLRGLEFAFVAIVYFRKTGGYLCTKFD